MKKLLSMFLALVLCLSLCACAVSDGSGSEDESSVTIVNNNGETEYLNGAELRKIHEGNPVAFENKYFEADVVVIGEVTKIHGSSILNGHSMDAYIELKGGRIIEANSANDVSDLMVGDTVKITGKIWNVFAANIYVYCINGHKTTIEKYNG